MNTKEQPSQWLWQQAKVKYKIEFELTRLIQVTSLGIMVRLRFKQ
jgi:hypothetical protein